MKQHLAIDRNMCVCSGDKGGKSFSNGKSKVSPKMV